MQAPKQILVPTDFSDVSDAAIQYALWLSELCAASLCVLHVVEDPLLSATLANGYALPPHFLEELERAARDRLERLLTPADRDKLHAQLVVREGSPFVEIVRYAREQNIDLIVMGTHGRGPIAHMLLGSVAEQVLRKAPCPVLVVRKPRQEFVMP